jgi:hypothetical protein
MKMEALTHDAMRENFKNCDDYSQTIVRLRCSSVALAGRVLEQIGVTALNAKRNPSWKCEEGIRVSVFPPFGFSSVLLCFVRLSLFSVPISLFVHFSLPASLLLFLLVQTNRC